MGLTASASTALAPVSGVADQAAGLRSMLNRVALRVLPIVGGGSGVGKNAIVARLAQYASRTHRVVVLDQTPGEVAAQLGIATRCDLQDLLSGRLEFGEVAVRVATWRLVPAQRGLTELLAAGAAGPAFFRGFLHLNQSASLLILNLADQEMALPEGSDGVVGEVLLVTTPRTESLTAAYARMKRIAQSAAGSEGRIRILVNGAIDYAEGWRVFRSLSETARNFLDIDPLFGGYLPCDAAGAAFGCPRRVPTPECSAALSHVAASIDSWRLSEYALDQQATTHAKRLQ